MSQRWVRTRFIAIGWLFSFIGCSRTGERCASPKPPLAGSVPPLVAGEYGLSFSASCGSRKGETVQGNMQLVAGSTDTSPTTRQVAGDIWASPPLYGWVDIDLSKVGAPICRGGAEPPPASRRPSQPGVVMVDMNELRRIDPAIDNNGVGVVLAIGTPSNLRGGSPATDGCGIGMFFEAWDGGCYRGSWGPWSITADGAGAFRACPQARR